MMYDVENWNLVFPVIKDFLANIFEVLHTDKRIAHPNAPDYCFCGEIGTFKCVVYFYIPEWIVFANGGLLELELQKKKEQIKYWTPKKNFHYQDGDQYKNPAAS